MTLGSNPNYTVTPTDGTLTVNPAVATVTANAKSKTYGDANPALDAVVTGAVNGDALNYTPGDDGAEVSGVGSYPITVTLGRNPNYTVTTTDAALTVNAAVATVTANAKSKTYGDANPALDGGGDRRGQRRHAQLQPGDDGAEVLGRRQLPDHCDARRNPNYTVTHDRRHADGEPRRRRR